MASVAYCCPSQFLALDILNLLYFGWYLIILNLKPDLVSTNFI
jgi:hypothetical protein